MTEDEMGGWYHRLNGHEFEKLQEIVKDGGAWHAAVHGDTAQQWNSNTEVIELIGNGMK